MSQPLDPWFQVSDMTAFFTIWHYKVEQLEYWSGAYLENSTHTNNQCMG
jgi:hypothetical protein